MALNSRTIRVADTPDLIVQFRSKNAPYSISTATTKEIRLQNPSGTTVVKPGLLITDGTDGLLHYQANNTDFTAADIGFWKIQGRVVNSDGTEFSTEPEKFEVTEKLV